jgi:hypothetical protein
MSISRIVQLLSNRALIRSIAINIVSGSASQTDVITIEGIACSFTSDATPSIQEVSDGLIAAIAASSAAGIFEVSQGAGPTYIITLRPVLPLTNSSVAVSANLTLTSAWGSPKSFNDLSTLQDDIALIKAGIPLTAGETHIGEIGGNTLPVVVTPVVGAAAFHANDIVGGKLTLANAARVAAGSGIWQSLTLTDAAKQATELGIYLFNADLTVAADNAAEATSAADWLKFVGHVIVAASDYRTLANGSVATVKAGFPYKAASGTSLFAFIRCTGTPTFTANCLQLTFGMLRD